MSLTGTKVLIEKCICRYPIAKKSLLSTKSPGFCVSDHTTNSESVSVILKDANQIFLYMFVLPEIELVISRWYDIHKKIAKTSIHPLKPPYFLSTEFL